MGSSHSAFKHERQDTALFRSIFSKSKWLRCMLYDMVADFEKEHGRPPYTSEIAQTYYRHKLSKSTYLT